MSEDAMGVPACYNTTLTSANTEYSQALPAMTRYISVQNRSSNPLRISFTTGKVATPTAPFWTIKAGAAYNSPVDIKATGLTLYMASPNAGDIAEIEAWT